MNFSSNININKQLNTIKKDFLLFSKKKISAIFFSLSQKKFEILRKFSNNWISFCKAEVSDLFVNKFSIKIQKFTREIIIAINWFCRNPNIISSIVNATKTSVCWKFSVYNYKKIFIFFSSPSFLFSLVLPPFSLLLSIFLPLFCFLALSLSDFRVSRRICDT